MTKQTSQAGKGDTPRPVDRQKFDANFDRIFRPKAKQPERPSHPIEYQGGKD